MRGQDFADDVIDAFDWLHRESRHGARMLSIGLQLRIIGRVGFARRDAIARHGLQAVPPG